jgi:hypothetical protein
MFETLVPNVRLGDNSQETSGQTPLYNCIAHSVQTALVYIWPDADEEYAWPPTLPRNDSVPNFVEFYQQCGFEPCGDPSFEEGYEKIVIFQIGGRVAHAALQLENGHWTSKIGDLIDIEHIDLQVVSGGVNGAPTQAVRRRATGLPPQLPPLHPPLSQLVNSSGTPLARLTRDAGNTNIEATIASATMPRHLGSGPP